MVLLTTGDTREAVFLERPNRFLCRASLEETGNIVLAHVADPGRLTELLCPGNRILLCRALRGAARKTSHSLVAARRGREWVLVNTTFHRAIADAVLRDPALSPFGAAEEIRAEVRAEGTSSRLDFLLRTGDGRETWLEVKGCTLAEGTTALFPDAPTARGRKHLSELAGLVRSGRTAALLFLVFPAGVECIRANRATDPGFADALRIAVDTGVAVRAVKLGFDGTRVTHRGDLPVCV
jgi:sugar fermentation stimulation protein A